MSKDYKQVWDNCLRFIKDNVKAAEYRTWFETIVPVKLNGKVLTIQVPSTFYYEYLEETYIDLLRKALLAELGEGAGLEYNVVMQNNMPHQPSTIITMPTNDKRDLYNNPVNMPNEDHSSIKNPFVIPGIQKLQIDPKLNNRNTFNRLVEGEFNRLARSAGYAIATNPGKTTFNPLFIYGASGLGKTHLAQAIGIETKDRYQDKVVLYVTGHEFETQFVDATINNKRNDFLHFYQMIDLLIIDDIHELSGNKAKTQDIFFEIFNHLHQTGKQLIITSDKAPADMEGIEERLLSRFKWGLSAELTTPDYESRKAILKQYAYNEGIEISDDILDYVAAHITNNIRELEGALISLLAHSTLNKETITIELARQIIDKLVKNTTRELSVGYIQKVVCDYFNLQAEAITSKTRKREIVQARQIAMYFAKNMTKLSLATIGSQIGGKDHATVLHACKTVNNLIDTDRQFKGYIDEIEKKLKI